MSWFVKSNSHKNLNALKNVIKYIRMNKKRVLLERSEVYILNNIINSNSNLQPHRFLIIKKLIINSL